MSSELVEKLRTDSVEDFEFLDSEGDLEVDLSKSPLHDATEKLTSGVSNVLSALSLIAEEQGIMVAIPVQAMAATAVGALAGSLLGGPSGLAIGKYLSEYILWDKLTQSTIRNNQAFFPGQKLINFHCLITGAVIAYRNSPSKQSSGPAPAKTTLREIFSQMTLHQKKELIKELLSCLKQSNVRCLILEILKNEPIRNMAMEILSSYLKRKMGLGIVKTKK